MDQLTIPAEEKLRPDEEKQEPKFSIEYMDRTADPLENFHIFAYGKWLKNNPIPGDKFRWGAVDELI